MKINEDAIRQLAELLNETGLTEIEVAEGEKFIRVNKGGVIMHGHGNHGHQSASQAPVPSSDPTIPQAANIEGSQGGATAESHPGAITSPMVGTAYMAAEPGSPDFVKKGDKVNEGDTVMIIEAMKVMNPIKAPHSGTVTNIIAKNEQPVEFGDVLMVIE